MVTLQRVIFVRGKTFLLVQNEKCHQQDANDLKETSEGLLRIIGFLEFVRRPVF
jgi:hypothetical protein